jgi:hypothetical protein
MLKRRRFKQTESLKDRLLAWTGQVRQQAAQLPPGPERDALVAKLRQADAASHIEDWINPPACSRRPRYPILSAAKAKRPEFRSVRTHEWNQPKPHCSCS